MPTASPATASSTSSDLLALVRQHDRDAWRRFVALYAPLIYGWCRAAQVAPADAGDITQEVLAKAFAAIEQFRHDRPGDTLRGWLRVICRRTVHDHFRRTAAAPQAAGGSSARRRLIEIPADEDEATILSQRHALVRRAAELVRAEFEPRTWQAFWLLTVEGRTAREAADRLSISVGAVRQAKYVVLRRLREQLSGELD